MRVVRGSDSRGRPLLRAGGAAAADPWFERFAARDPAAVSDAGRLAARIVATRGSALTRPEREDLVQETLAQVWEAIGGPGFDPARSFEAFVRVIATRRCIDWCRCRRPTCALPADMTSGERDPEASCMARERILLGRRLLGEIGHGCQELIRLHSVEGLTYAEIGRVLNRSEGALRVQMCACLGRARRLLVAIRGEEGRGAAPGRGPAPRDG